MPQDIGGWDMDDGSPTGTVGAIQGDSRFGDIRLGASPLSGILAATSFPSRLTLSTTSSRASRQSRVRERRRRTRLPIEPTRMDLLLDEPARRALWRRVVEIIEDYVARLLGVGKRREPGFPAAPVHNSFVVIGGEIERGLQHRAGPVHGGPRKPLYEPVAPAAKKGCRMRASRCQSSFRIASCSSRPRARSSTARARCSSRARCDRGRPSTAACVDIAI